MSVCTFIHEYQLHKNCITEARVSVCVCGQLVLLCCMICIYVCIMVNSRFPWLNLFRFSESFQNLLLHIRYLFPYFFLHFFFYSLCTALCSGTHSAASQFDVNEGGMSTVEHAKGGCDGLAFSPFHSGVRREHTHKKSYSTTKVPNRQNKSERWKWTSTYVCICTKR